MLCFAALLLPVCSLLQSRLGRARFNCFPGCAPCLLTSNFAKILHQQRMSHDCNAQLCSDLGGKAPASNRTARVKALGRLGALPGLRLRRRRRAGDQLVPARGSLGMFVEFWLNWVLIRPRKQQHLRPGRNGFRVVFRLLQGTGFDKPRSLTEGRAIELRNQRILKIIDDFADPVALSRSLKSPLFSIADSSTVMAARLLKLAKCQKLRDECISTLCPKRHSMRLLRAAGAIVAKQTAH